MIDNEELRWALSKLEKTGIQLKLVSSVLLTATLLNLSLVFAALGRAIYLNYSFITVLSVSITFTVFFLALWFDALRKDGKSYYDEISGVMHATSKNAEYDYEMKDNSIMARVAIRKFMNSYEIPLIPGKYGPGFLVILNIMIIVLWVAMSYTNKY